MTHDQELVLADRHIVRAEERVILQLQHIEHMEAKGQDTDLAEDVLLALERSLLAMQEHRKRLLDDPPA
jgi:hypothetical protein